MTLSFAERSIDDIEKTLDEIQEQRALVEEISNALSSPIRQDQFDEADLEEEYEFQQKRKR